jgi:hypothetical protein
MSSGLVPHRPDAGPQCVCRLSRNTLRARATADLLENRSRKPRSIEERELALPASFDEKREGSAFPANLLGFGSVSASEDPSMKPLVLLLSLALAGTAAAGDSGTTPYLALYQVLSPVAGIEAYDRLVAIERIDSKLPGVRPEDIRVVIHAKGGAIPVAVGAGGAVKFPVSDSLRAENPPVETNQPKGSLALIVNVGLRAAGELRVPWSEIEAGLEQAKAFYATHRGDAAPAISGVEVHFPPGGSAMLTIEGKDERLLMADHAGRIVVTRDMIAGEAAPELVFSRAPDFVLPYSEGRP